jgi:hypothetical protein
MALGNSFAQQAPGEEWHLLHDDDRWKTEPVESACGERIKPTHVYHCSIEAGPEAIPAIGTTCGVCRAALEDMAHVE